MTLRTKKPPPSFPLHCLREVGASEAAIAATHGPATPLKSAPWQGKSEAEPLWGKAAAGPK